MRKLKYKFKDKKISGKTNTDFKKPIKPNVHHFKYKH